MFMFCNEEEEPQQDLFVDPSDSANDIRHIFDLQQEPIVANCDYKAFKFSDFGVQDDDTDKKRQSARLRSKKTRERKKQYIQQLEARVKSLECENAKLRNELENCK